MKSKPHQGKPISLKQRLKFANFQLRRQLNEEQLEKSLSSFRPKLTT